MSVIRAGLATSGGNFLVNLANLGRDVSLAVVYGTAAQVDAFFLALMLPIFVATVGTGAYRSTIIPILERLRHDKGREHVTSLIAAFLGKNSLLVLGAGVFLAILSPVYVPFLGGRLPAESAALIQILSLFAIVMLAISACASLAEGPLQSFGRFFYPSLFRAALPLGIAGGALILGPQHGILGACYGGLIGAGIHFGLTLLLLRTEGVMQSSTAVDLTVAKEFRRQFGFLTAGVVLTYISPIVDQWMASFLGVGAVSVLGYANRLVVGVASIATAALGPALLPHFSRLVAAHNVASLSSYYLSAVRVAWWGGIILAGTTWLASDPGVALLYEHGNFTRNDSLAVSQVVAWFCLQFPPMLAGIVAATLLSATGHNQVFLPLSMLIAAVNAGGNWVLMSLYGLSGIAVSTVITYVVSCLVMNIILVRKGIIVSFRGLANEVAMSLGTAAAIAFALIIMNGKPSVIPTWHQLALGFLGVITYCGVAGWFVRHLFPSSGQTI